ncbi:MAG: ferric reductase-like transmembrane domain-containing protein [Pseudomonadota bacterium]
MLKHFSPYWLWLVLSIPAFGMLAALSNATDPDIFHELLHPSGEFAARFMIIAMLASPLVLVFRGWRGPRWFQKNRRYFGVAAFGYAALHTIFYLIDEGSVASVVADIPKFYIWTGWVAFLIFIPLAATSMDYFVRLMGPAWKTLQRTTYIAALFTLLHWAALHDWGGIGPALVHFGPLALLEAYRLWYWTLRPRRTATT